MKISSQFMKSIFGIFGMLLLLPPSQYWHRPRWW